MFRFNLRGKVDRTVERAIDQLYEAIEDLRQKWSTKPVPVVQQADIQTAVNSALLGAYGQKLIGDSSTTDPQIETLQPGGGTVTSVAVAGSTNISVSGSPITGAGTVTVTLNLNPSVTTVDATTSYKIAGTKVVGARGAAVPDATGGVTIDAEARTAINDLLARLRTHGLISP